MSGNGRTIFINGESRTVWAETIDLLVAELGIPPSTLLIEHNGNALKRDEWRAHPLKESDRIEILRIAAGG